ncbi:hypothetical protein K437DRAFT_258585 [Tilletiaria anomala UBC 951]|uniref:N-acetyltransferase domain-containing protein n=1 Tax=Tilletiaria anomala (strain ATCC 24038 / CBS 436.72 / UBC 951) TaxID=1037660 RepID=A0A066VPT4_TILAU|nr:uncharacterized protein K437DRAFT_258585 [Tilletiaria anomala UBC 951]KDN40600.1 hypothetical protein K437DRAFT_258585 [Tilletiaria anomala UBC 951]
MAAAPAMRPLRRGVGIGGGHGWLSMAPPVEHEHEATPAPSSHPADSAASSAPAADDNDNAAAAHQAASASHVAPMALPASCGDYNCDCSMSSGSKRHMDAAHSFPKRAASCSRSHSPPHAHSCSRTSSSFDSDDDEAARKPFDFRASMVPMAFGKVKNTAAAAAAGLDQRKSKQQFHEVAAQQLGPCALTSVGAEANANAPTRRAKRHQCQHQHERAASAAPCEGRSHAAHRDQEVLLCAMGQSSGGAGSVHSRSRSSSMLRACSNSSITSSSSVAHVQHQHLHLQPPRARDHSSVSAAPFVKNRTRSSSSSPSPRPRSRVASSPGGTRHVVNGGGGLRHGGVEWSGKTLHAVELEMERLGRAEWMTHAPDPVYLASRLEAVRRNLEVEQRELEEEQQELGLDEAQREGHKSRKWLRKRWLSWSEEDEDEEDEKEARANEHKGAVRDHHAPNQSVQDAEPATASAATTTVAAEALPLQKQTAVPRELHQAVGMSPPAQTIAFLPAIHIPSHPASPNRASDVNCGSDSYSDSSASVAITPPNYGLCPPLLLRPPTLLGTPALVSLAASSAVAGADVPPLPPKETSCAPPPTQVDAVLSLLDAAQRRAALAAVCADTAHASADLERLRLSLALLPPIDHASQMQALEQRVDVRNIKRTDLEQVRDLHCLHGDERLLGMEDGDDMMGRNLDTYTTSATFLLRLLVDENYIAVVAVAKPLPEPPALPATAATTREWSIPQADPDSPPGPRLSSEPDFRPSSRSDRLRKRDRSCETQRTESFTNIAVRAPPLAVQADPASAGISSSSPSSADLEFELAASSDDFESVAPNSLFSSPAHLLGSKSGSGRDDGDVVMHHAAAFTDLTGATSVHPGNSPALLPAKAELAVAATGATQGGHGEGEILAGSKTHILAIPQLELTGPEFIAPPPAKRVMAVAPPRGRLLDSETILGVASAIITYKHHTPESLWPQDAKGINICGPRYLDRSECSTVHLLTLSILPAERSQGLGGKLLDELLERAKVRVCAQHLAAQRQKKQSAQGSAQYNLTAADEMKPQQQQPKTRVYLEVHPSNSRAIELYLRKGFQQAAGSSGTKRGFYRGDERILPRIRLSVGGTDALVYEKWL